jgi:hypothetical protein
MVVSGGAWTEAEDAVLRAGIEAGKSLKKIAKGLPGRTADSAGKRGKALGLGRSAANPWTEVEDAALRVGVEAGKTWREIGAELPGRTASGAEKRGKKLGLSRPAGIPLEGGRGKGMRWTEVEDAAIRAGFEAGKTWQEIAEELPGRGTATTKQRGHVLGLKHREGGVPWTEEEDAALRASLEAEEPWKTVAEKLPGRTSERTRARARRLQVERSEKRVCLAWTEAEDEELRAGFEAGESWKTIAEERLVGRSEDTTGWRGRTLGLRRASEKGRFVVAWTDAGGAEVVRARRRRAEGPRVPRRGASEPWTEAEDTVLREGFTAGKKWKEIGEALPGRTLKAMQARVDEQFEVWRARLKRPEQ